MHLVLDSVRYATPPFSARILHLSPWQPSLQSKSGNTMKNEWYNCRYTATTCELGGFQIAQRPHVRCLTEKSATLTWPTCYLSGCHCGSHCGSGLGSDFSLPLILLRSLGPQCVAARWGSSDRCEDCVHSVGVSIG